MNKILKQVLISAFFLLFLNISFYGLKLLFFQNGNLWTSLILFFVALLFVLIFFVFLVLSFLHPIIRDDRKMRDSFLKYVVYAIGALFILLWFKLSVYTLIAVGILLILFVLADISIKREEKSFYKFRFEKIFRSVEGLIFSGFAVLIAFLVFLSPRIAGGSLNLPRSLYDSIFPRIEKIYANQMPGFSGDMTVDEYLLLSGIRGGSFKGTPLENLEKPKTYEELKQIFNSIQSGPLAAAFQEALKQGRDQFSKAINIEVKGEDKMKDVLYNMISSQISSSLERYKQISIVALIFILFLLIRTIISLFGLVYAPLAFLIFKIFQKAKFFKLEEETVQREKITI